MRKFLDAASKVTHVEHLLIEDFPSAERIKHRLDLSVMSKEIAGADICVLRKAVEALRHERQWRGVREFVEDELKDFVCYILSSWSFIRPNKTNRRTTKTFHGLVLLR